MDISRVMIPGDESGLEYWSISSRTYVRNNKEMRKDEGGLKGTAKTPLPSNYQPELDVSNELNNDLASRYSQVSVLAQYLALPRVGHLQTVLYHIFSYLNKHDKSCIIFDHADPIYDPNAFIETDWSEFYGDVEEEMPPQMPEPLGSLINMTAFVDANHAGNVVTHRFHTGIIIYLQNTPSVWNSR
jgi:hypothetical protein